MEARSKQIEEMSNKEYGVDPEFDISAIYSSAAKQRNVSNISHGTPLKLPMSDSTPIRPSTKVHDKISDRNKAEGSMPVSQNSVKAKILLNLPDGNGFGDKSSTSTVNETPRVVAPMQSSKYYNLESKVANDTDPSDGDSMKNYYDVNTSTVSNRSIILEGKYERFIFLKDKSLHLMPEALILHPSDSQVCSLCCNLLSHIICYTTLLLFTLFDH